MADSRKKASRAVASKRNPQWAETLMEDIRANRGRTHAGMADYDMKFKDGKPVYRRRSKKK